MTDLTQQEVLEQLRTRGFETGGFRSPLQHFRGKLNTITASMEQRGGMDKPKLEFHFNFSELEVFKSDPPYAQPIGQLDMWQNNRDKSPNGVLGNSIDKIINAGVDENLPQGSPGVKNMDVIIGKVQEWKLTPGHMMWDGQKQMETPRECFEVVYIEGVGGTPHSGVAGATTMGIGPTPAPTGTTPEQEALPLLDGVTQQEWNNLVFQNPLIKGKPELTQKIIDGAFIAEVLAANKVSKDDNGVFHVA